MHIIQLGVQSGMKTPDAVKDIIISGWICKGCAKQTSIVCFNCNII